MINRCARFGFGRGLALGAALLSGLAARAVAAPDFAAEILPIFQRSCYSCHGPQQQKSGYRLDVREVALKGGDSGQPAILAHNGASSPILHFVSGADPDLQMPPKGSGVVGLTVEEVALLRAWIDAGPSWPDALAGGTGAAGTHWSLKPLARPTVPGASDNAIDGFVQAALSAKGMSPSTEADKRTLLRRVYYGLTGLPPSPEETDAFLADANPAAYEKVVERLLASPRHGERWARHWLDTIHFADSHGYEHDIGRPNAWPFRDYVIESFNNDTPWPRFVREQLAADVFYPDGSRLTRALGYLGAGTFDLSTYSTGPITFEYLDRDDLVTQTMAAFTSTTANCARCHAHKFDPISQEDYYALQAVFAGVLKGDVAYDEDADVARDRKRWNSLLAAADNADAAVLLAEENAALVRDWLAERGTAAQWSPLAAETYVSLEGATLSRRADGVILSGGTRPDKDTYTITAPTALAKVTGIRLDVHTEDALPMKGPGRRENGNFHLSEFEARLFEAGGAEGKPLAFARATADFDQEGWDIAKAIDGKLETAWGVHPAEGKPHYAVFELAEPVTLAPGARIAIAMKQAHGDGHLIGAFSLALTGDDATRIAADPLAVTEALAVPESARNDAQRAVIAATALRMAAREALAKLPAPAKVYAAAKEVALGDGAENAMKLIDAPRTVNVLARGDFDKPGALATPGALSALTHLPARFDIEDPNDEAARRAALADWLAHPENALMWRSIVNRVWAYHFGRGLCDTPSDFGRMGGTPSHPELIDWLAVWFRDDAQGSLKALHRLIVTSATYRQSSEQREDMASLDADNRLLWRQNRARLDADSYRDFALAASGRLDLTMGGPGIQHFSQGKGPQLTPALDYTTYDWTTPGAGRRSIYRFVWRGIADPFMEALDFPDLGLLSPTRGFSASSLQALALFNNDFVLAQSAALAHRAEAEAPTLDAQVARAVYYTWGRPPDAAEQAAFTSFAQANGLAPLCRVLFNSNEFLFVD